MVASDGPRRRPRGDLHHRRLAGLSVPRGHQLRTVRLPGLRPEWAIPHHAAGAGPVLAARCARPAAATATGKAHAEAEVTRAVAEAVNDTAAAAAAMFIEVGAVADAAAVLESPASASPKKSRLLPLSRSRQRTVMGDGEERREGAALEKLQELEQCVRELESESEKVFRSLVQTRVSLLNIHTRQHFSYSLV